MSTENEALVRRWFEEVWNQGKQEAIDTLLSEDAIAHSMGEGGADLTGREGFKAIQSVFCGAFPDLHVDVDQVIASGDLVATHITCTGTHLGNHLGFAATGKPVRFTGMTLVRIRNGWLVEGWNLIDFLSMLQQIGKIPPKMSEI
jgi:steroid delta-isomerase-like uncharacterized protein